MNNKFTSRKFLIIVLAFTVGITMAYFKLLDSIVSDFIFKMTALYVAGNVGIGLANVIKANKQNNNNLQ